MSCSNIVQPKFHDFRILDGIDLSDVNGQLLESGNRGWYRIAYEGRWDGHWQGPFSLRANDFDQIIDNFSKRKTDIPVDYDHQSDFSLTAPASGWIKGLEKRNDDKGVSLWADVEFTNRAAEAIKAKEYRYLSPSIKFQKKNRQTGVMTKTTWLGSLALTNQPFLEDNSEARLNRILGEPFADLDIKHLQEKKMDDKQFAALAKALGLAETATVEEVSALCEQLKAASALNLSVLGELGLAAGASKEQVVGAVLQLKNPANQVNAEAFAALQMKLVERDAMDAVRAAQGEGKIYGDSHPQFAWALSYAKKDLEGFKAWVACAGKVVPLDTKKPDGENNQSRALTAEEKDSCEQMGITPEQFLKYNAEAK